MADQHEPEHLAVPINNLDRTSDQNSTFPTLWTEFARSHSRLSSPRTPTRAHLRGIVDAGSPAPLRRPRVELRGLEYVSDYDSNLMCPICHIPFIEPVVLDCDHTFCGDCFEEYKNGGSSTDRARCPTCRSYYLAESRKASRLIRNMCNDIQVRCPNKDCESIMARGCVEQHATTVCLEQQLPCPDSICRKQVKRKNLVAGQCTHNVHVECDCGATVQLESAQWLKHKAQGCSSTNPTSSIEAEDSASNNTESHKPQDFTCPGAEYGCTDQLNNTDDLETHTKLCPLARLAPHMKKQATLLQHLQDQLTMTKIQNEVLETGLDRLSQLVNDTIRPKLETLLADHDNASSMSDVEEIPRDLSVLPAHLRELTPSPNHFDLEHNQRNASGFSSSHHTFHNPPQIHLEHRISSLENHFSTLQAQLSDLDARSSLALMNETLRIREELAQINGAMYSTRAQVQWLLNRERLVGQREAMRGRVGAAPVVNTAVGNSSAVEGEVGGGVRVPSGRSGSDGGGSTQRPDMNRSMSSAWSACHGGAGVGPASGPSSASTSPIFSATRPSLRRPSGSSSQERVKL